MATRERDVGSAVDDALLARGRRHVRIGVALGFGAMLGFALASLIPWSTEPWTAELRSWLPGLLVQAIVCAGVLASSRIARGAMVVVALGMVPLCMHALVLVLPDLDFARPSHQSLFVYGLCGIAQVVGTSLAVASPAARAWHAARRRAREARRAVPLASWRSTGAER